MRYFGTPFEIKTVDLRTRVISGYAARHNTPDRVGDIIDPSASVRAVRRIKSLADVGVFVGHDDSQLPVGIPLKIEATPEGLYTETKIKPGPVGDDLLHTAKFLRDNGQSLGMSIGYYTKAATPDRREGKLVRRIMDYQLREYSYAAPQMIAHPDALVTSVKSRRKALSEGSDPGGGMLVPADRKGGMSMQYRVAQQGDSWAVICDADDDADADDNQVVGTYPSQEMANAVALALRKHGMMADDDEEGEEDNSMEGYGKTMSPPGEAKAVWTTKYVDGLPDSSFLFVEDGGVKDSDGKTVPRGKRHFPYRDASGKIDLPHLRNAIARIPQATVEGLDDAKKASLQARARKLLEDTGDGKTIDESLEWKTGAPLAVRAFGYRLLDLSDHLAEELKALRLLGDETKDGMRIRETHRAQLRAVAEELKTLTDLAEMIDRGEDGAARNRRYLTMLELNSI